MLTPYPINYLDLTSDILDHSKVCDDELINRFKQYITDSDYCFGTNKFSLITIQDLKDLFNNFDEEYKEDFEDDNLKELETLSEFLKEIQQTNPGVYVNLEN